jgi:para-aminobenzoate synthetase component II
LGVCLGHQAIGQVFGGRVVRAREPVHGEASSIQHDGTGVFAGLPQGFAAGRYHSLVVEDVEDTELRVTARSETGEIMGLQHKSHPTYGVQFHPESILTEHGYDMLRNFLKVVG